MTNYGNGYKFTAIRNRRLANSGVMVQYMKKNGEWGKPQKASQSGSETPEDVVARLKKLNHCEVRLAQ